MKEKKNTTTVSNQANQHILNIITPSGVDFDNTHVNIGENVGKIYTISKYPAKVDYGWLASLCNLEGTSTTLEFRYTNSAELITVFNKKIGELRGDKELAKQESDKQRLDQAINDLEKMINRLTVKDEPVGYVNAMLHIQDTSKEALNNRIKKVSGMAKVQGCNLLNLKYKQQQALKCIAPYGMPNVEVANMGARNMPMSTFIGGFPMASAGINDQGGYYLGKTKDGKFVILNQWLRNKDRVNSNWFITGLPGSGKSTFLKDVFVKELAYGTKIILLDPEEEYVDLARHQDINGDVIDCAGGVTGRINPLQIKAVPRVTVEDLEEGESLDDFIEFDENNGVSDMALYIQSLRVFFKCYFGKEEFSSGIKTQLEKCLIEVYEKFGITWETDISALANEDFPILSDLYKHIEGKKQRKGISDYERDILTKLSDLVYPMAEGADKYIWNGHTTLNPKAKFIVLNTSKLLDLDENVKRAQYMNINQWVWGESAKDRTEKILYGVDEGYLCVDPDYPDLMKFLRNYSKRDRKYECGLMFITHSVVDVLDPAVKRLGQAIIDNACYKFIMGCDGKNLEETKKLFKLTEKEENILASKQRGQGILFAGNIRMEVSIDVREKFLEMFGKAGGR